MPPKSNAAFEQQVLLILARLEGNVSKLDEQVQCARSVLSEMQGGMQMLIEAQVEEEEEDETDDEATHSTTEDDGSDSDMSFVVPDHSSSSDSGDMDEFDTQDSF